LCAKLSDFTHKKITTEYDYLYDTNKDGFVDLEDIEHFKRKLRVYLQTIHGHALKDTGYKPAYSDYWKLMHELSDTNRDGRLSRDEWIATWTKIHNEAKDTSFRSLPQWVQIMPHSIFPVMDTKGDGVIDEEEYKNFWYHVGGYPPVTESQLKQIFEVMTEGGTKQLDVQRVQELYADFYLSDDPSTPGRYIAGPIEYQ